MIRAVMDENVGGAFVQALRQRAPTMDLILARNQLPPRTPDPTLLAWAAAEGRVLISHDRDTMIHFANARVAAGLPMAGVIIVDQNWRPALYDFVLVNHATDNSEWIDKVEFLPY